MTKQFYKNEKDIFKLIDDINKENESVYIKWHHILEGPSYISSILALIGLAVQAYNKKKDTETEDGLHNFFLKNLHKIIPIVNILPCSYSCINLTNFFITNYKNYKKKCILIKQLNVKGDIIKKLKIKKQICKIQNPNIFKAIFLRPSKYNYLKKNIICKIQIDTFHNHTYKKNENGIDLKSNIRINKIKSKIAYAKFIREEILHKKPDESKYSFAKKLENNLNQSYIKAIKSFDPKYGENPIKEDIKLGIENENRNAFIFGPTGSGKTATLSKIAILNYFKKMLNVVPASEYYSNAIFDQITIYEIPPIEGLSNFTKEVTIFSNLKNQIKPYKKYILCLDELFRSTSQEQAKNALGNFSNILLENKENICLISTHNKFFTQFSDEEKNSIQNYHMEIEFENETFKRTFKIKKEPGWWMDNEKKEQKEKYSQLIFEEQKNNNISELLTKFNK